MSGDDVRSIDEADARKNLLDGARTARAAAGKIGDRHGSEPHAEIIWVGEQQRMFGYCGRAAVSRPAAAAAIARPRALLQRPRGVVVRIGPKPLADTAGAPARAA